ncbi:MAG: MFS transporter [Verrucomicrobia bacterium]|nr:MFS transporter [Verrucomicrobiota bacterium]
MPDASRTQQTYLCERWRALSAGILETAGTTFLLLIAVRHYEAGPFAKSLVAAGGSLGLMLAPWVVTRVAALGWPTAQASARLAVVGAGCFLVMALVPVLPVFVIGAVLAMTTSSAVIPLLTQIYQENYPDRQRGKLFSRAFIIRIATAALFSELAGRALSNRIGYFPWLLAVFAGAFAFAALTLVRIPSHPLTKLAGTHPFRSLRYARDDRLFRQTLISWMFLGFATLMMLPLRVEYLANEKHGVLLDGKPLTAATIALLTGVVPNLARLVLNPLWGWLFDRMNFFVLRITLNIGFALGALSFFVGGSMPWLVLGAILFGIANAGADLAWSLWVTKFAPPERVADYMSAHTFFTGLRGLFAPLVAFYVLAEMPLYFAGWICAGLILIGTGFLIPEIKHGRRARPASALVEEISE